MIVDNTKKISVIIPSYNSEKYIGKCLDSLFDQKYQNFEIVIVDDCSSDKTLSIIKKYGDIHPDKIIYRHNTKNMGPSVTRNEAIRLAHYDYIACIDSDAIAPYDWLKKGAQYFDKSDLFSGRFTAIPVNRFEEAVFAMTNFPDVDITYKKGDTNFAVAGTNIFFTRAVFDAVGGFNSQVRACEDTLFLRQCLKLGIELNYFHELSVFHSCKDKLSSYIRYFDVVQRWCRGTHKICPFDRYRHFSGISLLFLIYIILGIFLLGYKLFIASSVSLLLLLYFAQVYKFIINKKNDYTITFTVFLIAGFLKILNIILIIKIYIFRLKPKKYWKQY